MGRFRYNFIDIDIEVKAVNPLPDLLIQICLQSRHWPCTHGAVNFWIYERKDTERSDLIHVTGFPYEEMTLSCLELVSLGKTGKHVSKSANSLQRYSLTLRKTTCLHIQYIWLYEWSNLTMLLLLTESFSKTRNFLKTPCEAYRSPRRVYCFLICWSCTGLEGRDAHLSGFANVWLSRSSSASRIGIMDQGLEFEVPFMQMLGSCQG